MRITITPISEESLKESSELIGLDHLENIKYHVYHYVPTTLLSTLSVFSHLIFINPYEAGTVIIPGLQTRKVRYTHHLNLAVRAPGSNNYYLWHIILYMSLFI